jgi:hypothetical protein
VARLDGPALEIRLLVDRRYDLVAERTRVINRLRGTARARSLIGSRLPGRCRARQPRTWPPPSRSSTASTAWWPGWPANSSHGCGELNAQIDQLEQDLAPRVASQRPVAAGASWLWGAHCGQAGWRDHRRAPVLLRCSLRPRQRHRLAAGMVGQPAALFAQPYRQLAAQSSVALHRHHSDPPPP